jgi:hypothetical protein
MTTLGAVNRLLKKAQDLQAKRAGAVRGLCVRPPMVSRAEYEAQHGPINFDAYRFNVATALHGLNERDETVAGLICRPAICAELAEVEAQVFAEHGLAQRATVYIKRGV